MKLQLLKSADLNSRSVPRILDIGGEGRFASAWNLNPSQVRTLGSQRGSAIPRHILGRADQIPLPDNSVQLIICERTPLRNAAYLEIKRVVAPDGFVLLRHALPPCDDPHRLAYGFFPHQIHQHTFMLAKVCLQETLFYNGCREGVIQYGGSRCYGG